jgi:hypothetical protein
MERGHVSGGKNRRGYLRPPLRQDRLNDDRIRYAKLRALGYGKSAAAKACGYAQAGTHAWRIEQVRP